MLASAVLNLPDSFVLGVILALLLLLTSVGQYLGRKTKRQSGIWWAPIVVLAIGTIVCLGYASVTVVPKHKVVLLSNLGGFDHNGEPLPQGLQFKAPWDNTEQYDDVIVTASFHPEAPMSEEISTQHSFTWSYLAENNVDGSYLLANECIRTFTALIKAGQSDLQELPCNYGDKSLLVIRE